MPCILLQAAFGLFSQIFYKLTRGVNDNHNNQAPHVRVPVCSAAGLGWDWVPAALGCPPVILLRRT